MLSKMLFIPGEIVFSVAPKIYQCWMLALTPVLSREGTVGWGWESVFRNLAVWNQGNSAGIGRQNLSFEKEET